MGMTPPQMKYKDLMVKHPEYRCETWVDYHALYKGGETFRARLPKFLQRNPQEDPELYAMRCRSATYRSYCADIIDTYVSRLMAAPYSVASSVPGDDYYQTIKDDADGDDQDVDSLLSEVLRLALVKGSAWVEIDRPMVEPGEDPQNLAEYQARGLDKPKLEVVCPSRIINWSCGEWVVEYEVEQERYPGKPTVTIETWEIYDEEMVSVYEVRYTTRRPTVNELIPKVKEYKHGFAQVPWVRFCLDDSALWLMDRLADAQVAHFRASAAMTWARDRACYPVWVFRAQDANSTVTVKAGGINYIGTEESLEAVAPSTAPYEVLAKDIAAQKDEIYRIGGLMASGVDNSTTALGRSGLSKMADQKLSEATMRGLGQALRNYLERLLNLVGTVRPGYPTYTVSGFDNFDLPNKNISYWADAIALPIESGAYKKACMKHAAESVLSDDPPEVVDQVRSEIDGMNPEPRDE